MTKNIIIFIIILAIVGVTVFFDVPKIQNILYLKKQIEEQEELLSKNQTLLARIGDLTKTYEASKKNIEKIGYVLPSDEDTPNLIVQLEALAFAGGLVLEGMSFTVAVEEKVGRAQQARTQAEVVPEKYQTLTIDLSLIGTYSAFKAFLKSLEKNIRLMDIISVSFSGEEQEDMEVFNFSLKLRTYYQ
jgi:Tfp pilus assembly protein PilO